jgi:hypothetical protein
MKRPAGFAPDLGTRCRATGTPGCARSPVGCARSPVGARGVGWNLTGADARHLAWLRDEVGDLFVAGIAFHTGPHVFPLADRIVAAPVASLWS